MSKNNYRITVSEIEKFLLYQVWSASSETLNEERSVIYQKANKWVKIFNSLNAALKASNKPLFTPTTVMEIGDNKYVFVLDKAKLKGNNVVFRVSTKGFLLSNCASKKLLKLPSGKHDGVRFDIDSQDLEQIIFPLGSNLLEIGAVLYSGYALNWESLGNINGNGGATSTTQVYALWSSTQGVPVVTEYGGYDQYVFASISSDGGKGFSLVPISSWHTYAVNVYNLVMGNASIRSAFGY